VNPTEETLLEAYASGDRERGSRLGAELAQVVEEAIA
jgi:hypothetical protein